MTRILVLGRNGQLAKALARLDGGRAAITCMGRENFDIADLTAIPERLRAAAPDTVINAAALAAVDQAESDPGLAFLLNRDAPEALARACEGANIPFVHVSTDYVFDGEKGAPYVETDTKAPINVYGVSKSEGEDRVLAANPGAAIIRTAAVFDYGGGRSFITRMLQAAAQGEARVVANEMTRPTPAAALAEACITVALRQLDRDSGAEGVFHFAGSEDATWIDYAEAIFAASKATGGPTARIIPVTRAAFPQPARRPRDTRLDSTKIAAALGVPPCSWREALVDCVRREIARTA